MRIIIMDHILLITLILQFWKVVSFIPHRHHHSIKLHQPTASTTNVISRKRVITAATTFDEYSPGISTDLAYSDTKLGDETEGPTAKPNDIITVQYSGRLLSNGKQFDAGVISFKLGSGRVIPGWDVGLQGMQIGGQRTLRIPPNLAYGRSGAGGGVIPPNADLEFDCELKSISSGVGAEVMAALGLGLNPRTGVLVVFLLLVSWLSYGVTFPE